MLMRTDPYRELDRLVQQVMGTPARPVSMPMDAYRDGETFVVHIDLPGVTAEAIDLQVEKNVLTVRAERSRSAADDKDVVVAERPSGSFSRQLFLGESLDADGIDAEYRNGVLTVRIPIAEKAKPRQIEVRNREDLAISAN